MRFQRYIINESTSGKSAWVKYFKGIDKNTYVKKTSSVFDSSNRKTDEVIEQGEEILVPSSSVFDKGKINVLYKGKLLRIQFSNIDKGATQGGETLKIPANNLLRTAQDTIVTVGSKTFSAKQFKSASDLSKTIINSLINIKTIPDNLKNILIKYLENGIYSSINWYGYDNPKHINEVAKYLGEIIIGLCVLNNETHVLSKNIFKKPVKTFIMPTSSSFVGIDSMFEMKDGSIVPISSKSGKGAPASFHANVMPVLTKNNIKTRSRLLSFMINEQSKGNYKNMEFIYNIGIKYVMENELSRDAIGRLILSSPYSIYQNISQGNITEKEEYFFEVIKKGKWPVMKNMKTIIKKLPNSVTYFLCQNIAELLNKDKEALDTIIMALASKEFWQANLDKASFHKGIVKFKMVSSGTNKVKVIQGKGSMNSVKSEQGRLSYFIS